MISDDLGGLFAPPPDGPAQVAVFRQGVLLSFDPSDGSNTVGIGTSALPDLPMALTGAEIGYQSGDNVLVAFLGNTAMILCKIASVGSPAFGSHSLQTNKAGNSASTFALPATTTDLVTATLTVPQWATTMSAVASFGWSARNSLGTDTDIRISLDLDGDSSNIITGYGHTGSLVSMTLAHCAKHSVTPNTIVTFKGQGSASGGFAANAANFANLEVIAIWTKE